jgi:NADPH:quinone reductase-like Zn-dependent oxidoreductase
VSQENILVTGAAGGVGSTAQTAIEFLLKQGHRVRAMVRKLDARADTLRNMGAEFVRRYAATFTPQAEPSNGTTGSGRY